MHSATRIALRYLRYYLTASNGKGHGVHSPFVFEFITNVLNDDRRYYCYNSIEHLRQQSLLDTTVIHIEDLGAGSRVHAFQERKISDIAASSLKSKKFAQLLFRIAYFYKTKTILELGTSLGITTAYLASANSNNKVITMEGSKAIANVARKNFEQLQIKNIEIAEGNFDDTLQSTLEKISSIDFAFIDGNHRKEPTIRYFEKLLTKTNASSILIFDDIHWSKEMEEAWIYIQSHASVTLSIDLFFIGIVFFRTEQKAKQHFTIRF